jgi:hypothetical protein
MKPETVGDRIADRITLRTAFIIMLRSPLGLALPALSIATTVLWLASVTDAKGFAILLAIYLSVLGWKTKTTLKEINERLDKMDQERARRQR